MKLWRTDPGSSRHAAANGAALTADRIRQGHSRHFVEGNSIMPPSRPRSGRRRSSTRPSPRVAQNATPWRVGRAIFGNFFGKDSWIPAARARQCAFHGQALQFGRRGLHTVAPRSISAWAKSPARWRGVRRCATSAISGLAAGNGVSIRWSRDITRSMFPSTGVAGWSNAIAAIAAAVYGPMPGRRLRSFSWSG